MADTVIGFLAFTSGAYEGAIIRDMRLANALHRRGFKVVVYWMMESNRSLVDPEIAQRTLCSGMRYHFQKPSGVMDALGRLSRIWPTQRRRRFMQEHPDYINRLMSNCCRAICDGDEGLSQRLLKYIKADGVTHLLPTFAMICPFAQRAAELSGSSTWKYLVTFQGEEIFANFAQRIGRLDEYHARLRHTITGSPWPAVAVSRDYIMRLSDEMGIDASQLRAIYPGIELPEAAPHATTLYGDGSANLDLARSPDFALVKKIFPTLRPDVPIVTYLGRHDAEKGIDLLIYAARMVRERGHLLQLVCVGGSSFGDNYRGLCKQIAEHLRMNDIVFWKRRISDEMRAAIYRLSRVVAYPSIHREPFGMVAAEAMSHGTPVLVPDHGGIQEIIEANGQRGGLTFKSWDSGDLADQLNRMLADDALYLQLSANTRGLAANFSVDRMADRVLEHIGLPSTATAKSVV